MVIHLLIGRGVQPTLAGLVLLLLLTYALHAVVWACAAAWFARHKALASAAQHSLWKLALFGPLVSAALAFAVANGVSAAPLQTRDVAAPWLAAVAQPAARLASAALPTWSDGKLHGALGAGLALAGVLGFLRWWVSALLFRRLIRGRKPLSSPRWLTALAELRGATGIGPVTLSQCAHIDSPLVLGLAEICVPPRLLGLHDAELRSVLAHELAHIERRDGVWFPLVGLLEAVLWMQPLNAWVVARFRKTGEEACDDRAVELTGDAPGLARVLVQLASRDALPLRGATVPTMKGAKGVLFGRVKRLVSADVAAPKRTAGSVRVVASVGLAVVGLATVGLSVRVATAGALPAAQRVKLARNVASQAVPDAAKTSARLAELERKAQEVTAKLSAAASRPGAERSGSPAAVRVLELQQELDHLRATEQWLEQRFVDGEEAP